MKTKCGFTVREFRKILKRVKNKDRIVVVEDELGGINLEPAIHIFEQTIPIDGKMTDVISIRARMESDYE